MGRSVAVPRDAEVTFYFPFEDNDLDDEWGDAWDDMIGEIRIALSRVSDLFESADDWVGREMHRIATNGIVDVVLCEYCGFCSLSLVTVEEPREDAWEPVKQVWGDFSAAWVTDHYDDIACELENFGLQLCRRVGSFSNGESVYERV